MYSSIAVYVVVGYLYDFTGSRDRAWEAAQMRLEYCDDAEGAIAILVLACKWTDAINVASKKQRFDLLLDEVCMCEVSNTMVDD